MIAFMSGEQSGSLRRGISADSLHDLPPAGSGGKLRGVSVQPVSPGAIVSRIWAIYRDQFSVLVSTAVALYAIQFVIYLVLGSAVSFALAILFWALSILYQGMVVKLVQDIQDGRRDHSVRDLVRSVEPVVWPLAAVSILFGIGVGIGFVLLIIPGLILLVIWSVVAPVTVLERPGIFRAFGRSRSSSAAMAGTCSGLSCLCSSPSRSSASPPAWPPHRLDRSDRRWFSGQ